MIKKANKAFTALEEKIKTKKKKKHSNEYVINLEELNNLFNKTIRRVKDTCLLVRVGEKNDWSLIEKNFDHAVKRVTDKTGYEAFNNSFRITDEFNDYSIPIEIQFELGYMVMNNLLMKKNFPEKSVFYFSVDQDELLIRFHTYRKEEGLYLDEDLEGYSNPVAYFLYE